MIKRIEIFSLLPLKNNSVTIDLDLFTTKHISNHITILLAYVF